MNNRLRIMLAVAGMAAALQAAAEVGYTLRVVELKAKPYLDSDTLAKLPEKAEVEIVLRNGPWMLVKTRNKQSGYVRLLQVRAGSEPTAADPGGWLALPGGKASSGLTTTAAVTTGVRGFSEDDLRTAQPNKAEYERMKSFAASPQQAAAFAGQAQLAARTIAYYAEDGKPIAGGKK
jgi:hypothetical protein